MTPTSGAAVEYGAWPGAADVLARLAAAGVMPRSAASDADAAAQAVIDSVSGELERRTLRQFVCDPVGAPGVRRYDGSGTSVLEIDEFVALVGVAVIGPGLDPGYALASVVAQVEQERPMTRLVRGVGGLPWGVGVGGWWDAGWHGTGLFPTGRQNIAVTAQFGYAATVPADVWEAVACEAAERLAREAMFLSGGQLQARRAGDEEERYAPLAVGALGWHARFEAVAARYKRPEGRRLRAMRRAMV